jgi:plasmid stabilization system protein ParE
VSLPLVFRGAAQDEYDEAAVWYDGRQPGLGTEFETEVQAVLDTTAGQPDRYPVVLRDVREAPVARFPYCIYYRVRQNRVVVISVFHTSRDPVAWQSRA